MAAIFTVVFAGPAAACPDPACDPNATWMYDWDGANTVTASLTVDPASGGLCEPKTLQASSYKVDAGWDGVGWNSTAVPQLLFDHQLIEFSAGAMTESKSATLLIPACGPYQVDLYSGEPQVEVTWPTGHTGFIKGGLVSQEACLPAVITKDAITTVNLTPTPPTCDVDGSLTLPQGEGFTWAGSVLGVGTHTVVATADAGWVFEDNSTVVKRTVIVAGMTGPQSTDANGGCYVAPVIVPPIVVPPVVDQPVVDQPVVVPPVVTAAVLVASTTPTVSSSRVLAYTGIDGLPWLLFGATGLIGLGALTLTRTVRERRVRAQA